mmetsp:Transcript_17692/g.27384  ORF Transcript_17692/g.27384 Transcript_17692/m.27384 type:complete len:98 (-) Transcript_17692:758-1051(-)
MLVFKNDEVFGQSFEIPSDWSAFFVYNTDPFFGGKLVVESISEEVTNDDELTALYSKWQPTDIKPLSTMIVTTSSLDKIQAEIDALLEQLNSTTDPN